VSGKLSVLIVGGYGTFGGRLVELFENDSRLTLIVAGRSRARADAFVKTRGAAKAQLVAAAFDRDGDVDGQLAKLRPEILVDASGPFQAYGEGQYKIVEACIAKGIHYLDLADGSDFVAGVSAFDAAARAAGIFVLSGVSSFPVLTAATVRRLSSDIRRIDAIFGGIAPSPYAGVGENVIRAIASYAGRPTALKRGGAWSLGHPFTDQIRFTIAPPGALPLKSTLFSLVDVPDLRALTELWPDAASIWMGAGPVPEILHRALIGFAWLVRLRIVPSLSPLAPLMFFATNRVRWGEHRGGMFVAVNGTTANGVSVQRSWHLLAEGDDGPLIPSMAVAAIIQKLLSGEAPSTGARAATRDLELEDYEKLFASRTITTGIREQASGGAPLYERVLGAAWLRLPAEIRAIHSVHSHLIAEGRADVERGRGALVQLIAWMMAFPKAGRDLPLTVQFTAKDGVETWTRDFAGQRFFSRQFAGRGRSEFLLCESFGPLKFAMALVARNRELHLVLRRWSFLRVPMPMWLCPRSQAFESVEGGRFRFYVEIRIPLIGLIVRYKGWLNCDNAQAGASPITQVSYGYS